MNNFIKIVNIHLLLHWYDNKMMLKCCLYILTYVYMCTNIKIFQNEKKVSYLSNLRQGEVFIAFHSKYELFLTPASKNVS